MSSHVSNRVCERCEFSTPQGISAYCKPCNDIINKRIRRWVDSDRELSAPEIAGEFGLSTAALEKRISRMRAAQ
jgi:hypothetical protein